MTYPSIPKHLTEELEWIKQRYEGLQELVDEGKVNASARVKYHLEMLRIDEMRTEIFLNHIKQAL